MSQPRELGISGATSVFHIPWKGFLVQGFCSDELHAASWKHNSLIFNVLKLKTAIESRIGRFLQLILCPPSLRRGGKTREAERGGV